MTTTPSKTEVTSKRITKNELNQLAKSYYGEEASCEHVRSGKRGWYLHNGSEQTFIGANATEAYSYLQSQEKQSPEKAMDTPASEALVTPDAATTIPVTPPSSTETAVPTTPEAATAAAAAPEAATAAPATSEATTAAPTASEAATAAPATSEATTVVHTASEATTAMLTQPEEAVTQTPVTPEAVTQKSVTPEAVPEKGAISPEELLEILIDKFPNTFFREPDKIRPVQKYIHKKIRRALNGEYTKDQVSTALALYTQTQEYCQKLIEGGERIDLEGKPCETVAQQHIDDAKARIAGEKPMRSTNRKKPKKPLVQLPPPKLDQLVSGKMEICVKINDLPADSKTLRNGWEEFIIDTKAEMVKISVRPKTWKKLQRANNEYPSWIANIRGKIGTRFKGGFELLMPGIQIFEKKPREAQPEAENNESTEKTT